MMMFGRKVIGEGKKREKNANFRKILYFYKKTFRGISQNKTCEMYHITNSSSFSVALGTADVKPALRLVAAIV